MADVNWEHMRHVIDPFRGGVHGGGYPRQQCPCWGEPEFARMICRKVLTSGAPPTSRPRCGVVGALVTIFAPIVILASSCSSGWGYLDEIREEPVVQADFDFMTEMSRRELTGSRRSGNIQPDEIERRFDLGSTPRDEALTLVIAFAQENGWSPDPRSARTPPAQLKPLKAEGGLRLIVYAVNNHFIMKIEGPI